MEKRTSVFARIFAFLALVVAIVALVAIVSGALNDDSSTKGGSQHQAKNAEKKHRTKAATYTVKPGDTLTAISHDTGVPVTEIVALNPEVDPQILIAGETLKLR